MRSYAYSDLCGIQTAILKSQLISEWCINLKSVGSVAFIRPSWLICSRECSLNRLARCQTLAKVAAICNGNHRYKCENMPQFLQRFEFHLQAWRALLEIKQELSERSDNKHVGVAVVLLKLKFHTDPTVMHASIFC